MDKDMCTRLCFENTIILANFLTAAELLLVMELLWLNNY